MRIRFVPGWAGITGLTLVLVACSQQCGANPISHASVACSGSSTAHRAQVVVEHGSGSSIMRCVGFSADSIDGKTAMRISGIEYRTAEVTSGKAMCQIDSEPAQFNTCFPQNQPYWALFVGSHGHWSTAPGGFTQVTLHNGDAMGWHYVKANEPVPAPPPLPAAVTT